jgi:hypothetical protein
MAKYKKLTFQEIITLLKQGRLIIQYISSTGVKRGYFIENRWIPANHFFSLLEQKVIILIKISKNKQIKKYSAFPNLNLNNIKYKKSYIICVICGKKFERNGLQITCNKKCSHIYHNQKVKYNSIKLNKEKHKKQISLNKKSYTITLSTGCIITHHKTKNSYENGRCEKYHTCKYNTKCLFELPVNWFGFKCINNCVGYKKADSNLQV